MASERSGKYSRHNHRNSAVKVGRANAHSDEREHVEAAINNRLPRAREEEPAGPKNHWTC